MKKLIVLLVCLLSSPAFALSGYSCKFKTQPSDEFGTPAPVGEWMEVQVWSRNIDLGNEASVDVEAKDVGMAARRLDAQGNVLWSEHTESVSYGNYGSAFEDYIERIFTWNLSDSRWFKIYISVFSHMDRFEGFRVGGGAKLSSIDRDKKIEESWIGICEYQKNLQLF